MILRAKPVISRPRRLLSCKGSAVKEDKAFCLCHTKFYLYWKRKKTTKNNPRCHSPAIMLFRISAAMSVCVRACVCIRARACLFPPPPLKQVFVSCGKNQPGEDLSKVNIVLSRDDGEFTVFALFTHSKLIKPEDSSARLGKHHAGLRGAKKRKAAREGCDS